MSTEGFQPLEELDFGASVRGFHAGQRLLDRYVLKRILGRGGMGVVWLVYDEALEREIAFKFLPEMVSHDRGALDDLKRETRRSLELTHPNIVRIYDFVHAEGCAGISMEFIDGDTLSNLRAERPSRTFEVSDLKPWLKQLCGALEYAHVEAKLAHRDLKPANLMLGKRGVLKVADFGISRSVSDTMTRVNFHQGASGTLVYMSPQQALGDRPSVTDDIYSLGATIFELLTSKPPFYQGEIMLQVREKSAPTMAERRKELNVEGEPIPPEWEETIALCLSKDPAKRPKSAQEIVERLGLEAPRTESRPAAEGVEAAVAAGPAPAGGAAEVKPAEPRPRMELVLDDSGIRGTEKRELPPPTDLVKKGKALVAIVVLLLLSLIAAWFVVSQANMARHSDEAAAKARVEASRKEAEAKEAERLRQEKIAAAKEAEEARLAREQAAKAEAAAAAERLASAKKTEEERRAAEMETARLENLRGVIRVETIPAGALVSIDGEAGQKSPMQLAELKLGTHRITLSREGYESTNIISTLVEDRTARAGSSNVVKYALVRSTGSALLDSVPRGAEITLTGDEITPRTLTTPAAFDSLPTGTYRAKVAYGGSRQTWETNTVVEVTANHMAKASFALPFGALTIAGQPEGATVMLGDQELGRTPLALGELPPGKVSYVLKKKGYFPKPVNGTVGIQQNNRLSYVMEAIKGPEKGDRWVNSLGMTFVPVGDGTLLCCIWETRVRDFAAFAKNNPYNVGTAWENPGFPQEPACPVVNVNWEDANMFCKWLTQHERNEGKLDKQRYRLPTDREWSQLVGLPREAGELPVDRDNKITGVFPWGTTWPPPAVPGNYDAAISYDAFDITSPAGSFRANRLGIFDLGGNVWEWCEDGYDATKKARVLRGGAWSSNTPEVLNSSYRRFLPMTERQPDAGFRVVLEVVP